MKKILLSVSCLLSSLAYQAQIIEPCDSMGIMYFSFDNDTTYPESFRPIYFGSNLPGGYVEYAFVEWGTQNLVGGIANINENVNVSLNNSLVYDVVFHFFYEVPGTSDSNVCTIFRDTIGHEIPCSGVGQFIQATTYEMGKVLYACDSTYVLGANPTAQGGVQPYSYEWISYDLNFSFDTPIEANPLLTISQSIEEESYIILRVTDSLGCSDMDTLFVMPCGIQNPCDSVYVDVIDSGATKAFFIDIPDFNQSNIFAIVASASHFENGMFHHDLGPFYSDTIIYVSEVEGEVLIDVSIIYYTSEMQNDLDTCFFQRLFSLEDSLELGINTYNEETLALFPNPTADVTTIQVSKSLVGQTYQVSNLLGSLMFEGVLRNETTELNLSTLAEGIYFLSVNQKNGQNWVQKLVKK